MTGRVSKKERDSFRLLGFFLFLVVLKKNQKTTTTTTGGGWDRTFLVLVGSLFVAGIWWFGRSSWVVVLYIFIVLRVLGIFVGVRTPFAERKYEVSNTLIRGF